MRPVTVSSSQSKIVLVVRTFHGCWRVPDAMPQQRRLSKGVPTSAPVGQSLENGMACWIAPVLPDFPFSFEFPHAKHEPCSHDVMGRPGLNGMHIIGGQLENVFTVLGPAK